MEEFICSSRSVSHANKGKQRKRLEKTSKAFTVQSQSRDRVLTKFYYLTAEEKNEVTNLALRSGSDWLYKTTSHLLCKTFSIYVF